MSRAGRLGSRAVAWLILAAAAVPAFAQPSCVGDCDDGGTVTVDEITRLVVLGLNGGVSGCAAGDRNGSGDITVDELVEALQYALNGCPATATPTATATATRTAPEPTVPTVVAGPSATPTPNRSATPTATAARQLADSFRSVALNTEIAARLALSTVDWLRLLEETAAAGDAARTICATAQRSCGFVAGEFVETVELGNCETSEGGRRVVYGGTVRRKSATTDPCTGAEPVAGETVRLELLGLTIGEYIDAEQVLELTAELRLDRTASGRVGCAGLDATEIYSGRVTLDCTDEALVVGCPEAASDLAVATERLEVERESVSLGGDACRIRRVAGGDVEAIDARRDERVEQRLEEMEVGETQTPEGEASVSVDGRFSANCLGLVEVRTLEELETSASESCPVAGALELTRPGSEKDAAAAPLALAGHEDGAESGEVRRGAVLPPSGELRQELYRALGGQLYQVVWNEYGANGAEAIRLTTAVGSEGDNVALCLESAGQSEPRAVAVARGGSVYPIGAVRRSTVLPTGGVTPCFNRNANDGEGRVCFGDGCSADCQCAPEAGCASFSLGEATQLEAGGGRLAGDLTTSCGEGFASRATYGFGTTAPTLQTEQCGEIPVDGIELAHGQAVVLVYDTQPLEQFNAAVAGFPIDRDGENTLCPGRANVAFGPGQGQLDTAAGARVTYRPGSMVYNYDGDESEDTEAVGCREAVRLECEEAATPTPTATPDPERPCGATLLGGESIELSGSTVGAADLVRGGGCGWGGGLGSPDRAYEYEAAASGSYVIEVTGADGFRPYLSVREESCEPERPELGCGEATRREATATVEAELEAGQRIAIVVDGPERRAGAFELLVRRRQPDLVVTRIEAQGTVQAGGSATVAAVVANQGDAPAGPFVVEFVLARDAAGEESMSPVPVRAFVNEGLSAGESRKVELANPFTIPLVAPATYSLVVSADVFAQIDEEDERNNAKMAPVDVGSAPGAVLEQHALRAEDGTVYQVLQARPVMDPEGEVGAARQFRIPMLAASTNTVETCETQATELGTPVGAAVGTAELVDLMQVRRTERLRPNTFAMPRLDAFASGTLRLGIGDAEIEVCADASLCPGAQLGLVVETSNSLPQACRAESGGGTFCAGLDAATTIAFGIDAVDASCVAPQDVTTQTTACFGAGTINGFDLRPGEAVVFVHRPGPAAYSVATASYGFAPSQANPVGCASGASTPHTFLETMPLAPALVFRQVVRQGDGGTLGLIGASRITASPNGKHLYVTSDESSSLVVLEWISATNTLRFVQTLFQGDGGVDGLEGAGEVAMSPEGTHLYVVSDVSDSIAVFQRDPDDGRLTFEQVLSRGRDFIGSLENARSVAVDPDGTKVYVVSTGGSHPASLTIFRRNLASGVLRFAQEEVSARDGVDAVGGRSVAVTPDGQGIYSAGNGVVTVFRKSEIDGRLQFVRTIRGVAGASSVAVSPDGARVYVAGSVEFGVGTISVLARDAETADLELVQTLVQGSDGVDGLQQPWSIAVGPDGADVYVASGNGFGAGAVAVFRPGQPGGELVFDGFVAQADDGVDGLAFACDLVVGADGNNVFVAAKRSDAVAILSRNPAQSGLQFSQAVSDFNVVDGIARAWAAALSPDGTDLYVVSLESNALAQFRRDSTTGAITFVRRTIVGQPDVDGLDGAPFDVVVSPDGLDVYVATRGGENAIAIFRRDPATGGVAFENAVVGVGGDDEFYEVPDLAVSPDGSFVYAANLFGNSIATFARQPATGALLFLEEATRANATWSKVETSPDGANLYAVGSDRLARGFVVAFERDVNSGELRFLQNLNPDTGDVGRFDLVSSLAVSSDGRNVYVAKPDARAVVTFDRDGGLGRLTQTQSILAGQDGAEGLDRAYGVVASADGAFVYVWSNSEVGVSSLAAYRRDPESGELRFEDVVFQGSDRVDGLEFVEDAVLSPDSKHVYAVTSISSAVVVFAQARAEQAPGVDHIQALAPQGAWENPLSEGNWLR